MSDITTRLRQTRANMLGTDDEQHYWDCQDAAAEIERLQKLLQLATVPAARHTPATRGRGELPPDVPQDDNSQATSGRGLFLTAEEREAIEQACDEGRWFPRDYHHIHTLRALLERTQ